MAGAVARGAGSAVRPAGSVFQRHRSDGNEDEEFPACGGSGRGATRTSNSWYITGRAGVWTWDADLDVDMPGVVGLDLDGTDFYFGAGFGYMFFPRFGAGLGATCCTIDVDDSDTGLYILGLNTTFTF
jgi:hypothetical protein